MTSRIAPGVAGNPARECNALCIPNDMAGHADNPARPKLLQPGNEFDVISMGRAVEAPIRWPSGSMPFPCKITVDKEYGQDCCQSHAESIIVFDGGDSPS